MITYMTEKDKNGKARYYRVTDGKKKVISRAEYEANICENSEASNEVTDTVVETASTPETAEENEQIAFEEVAASAETLTQNVVSSTELDCEPVSKDAAFDIVKGIVKATGSVHSEKMYLQTCKKCAAVNYRNYTVCSLIFSENGGVSAVKFMGATSETRKKATVYKLERLSDLLTYKDKVVEQIEYIDEWYANASKKNAKAS